MTAIAEAIVQSSSQGTPKPGTYDLITFPQWTWLDVYQLLCQRTWTADALDASRIRFVRPKSGPGGARVAMRIFFITCIDHPSVRERLTFLLAFLPRSFNQKMYLLYLQTRALAEINALRQSGAVEYCAPDWRELRVRHFGQMPDPATLMARYPLPSAFDFSRSI